MITSGLVADQLGRRTTIGIAACLIGAFAIGSILAPLLFGDSMAGHPPVVAALPPQTGA